MTYSALGSRHRRQQGFNGRSHCQQTPVARHRPIQLQAQWQTRLGQAHGNADTGNTGVAARVGVADIGGEGRHLCAVELDGFILANSEVVDGAKIDRTRLEISVDNSKVPGYYWQHISYVFIWWLMAALVLYLPFYRRRVTS